MLKKRGKEMRKAQAAMEFLMTYGWAILVVLVAIASLAYFGVLSPEQFLPEKCVISTGSGLFCDDFSIVDKTQVNLNLHNILTDDITAIYVTLRNTAGGTGVCAGSLATLAADTAQQINLSCIHEGIPPLSEKVKAELTIDYTVGGFSKKTTGQLVGKTP